MRNNVCFADFYHESLQRFLLQQENKEIPQVSGQYDQTVLQVRP